MIRKLSLALIGLSALAGCVTPEPNYGSRGPNYGAYPVPSGPSIYENAPRAPVHSQLFVCNRSNSNLGEISADGSSVYYLPYIETRAGALLREPVETACLSSGFGWRGSLDSGRQHNGIDLANPNGGWVFAAGTGRIRAADYRGGYGNTIEIDHGAGVRTLYAHMSEFDQRLRPGAYVESGQAIGRMGMTGNATGVHLHYEVWVDGLLVDPLHYGRPPTYVSAPQLEPLPLPDPAPVDKPAY